MALDLAGIGNVGEFFSQHYLDALLERDLKDTLARWKKRKDEERQQTPYAFGQQRHSDGARGDAGWRAWTSQYGSGQGSDARNGRDGSSAGVTAG